VPGTPVPVVDVAVSCERPMLPFATLFGMLLTRKTSTEASAASTGSLLPGSQAMSPGLKSPLPSVSK
jgi:hypothetical protein